MRDALRDAFAAGYRASGAPCITEAAISDAFSDWYRRVTETLDRAPLTAADQKQQGMSCSCRGTDDYCPCQNVRLK